MLIRQSDLGKPSKLRREWLKFILSEVNIPKSLTGLPNDVWIDSWGNERQTQHHKPRLKVNVDRDWIPVSIEDDPEILVDKKIPKVGKIFGWIRNKRQVLIQHWNREIDDRKAIELLRRR